MLNYNRLTRSFRFQRFSLQEQINIVNDQISKEEQSQSALKDKIDRYGSLKKIIEEINQHLDMDAVAEQLVSIAFLSIAKGKGTCILYLVDRQTQGLTIFKTKKEDKKIIIKAKEGDVFDNWVLRHATPLIIEDIRKDYRFAQDKPVSIEERKVSSLISGPFISDHRFLGILRLDSPEPGFYFQDDLRFLVTICDLGAVALESAELFHRTQELAIHDGLTGLYTKGYFMERLKDECKRSIRQNRKFSLLLLDIDHFKQYNDDFGHTAGDIVLRELSACLTDYLKDKPGLISRFGGEEFCVILGGYDKKEAFCLAEGLRSKIEMIQIILRRQKTSITVSIGVSTFPVDTSDEIELIIKADRAMYEAKRSGRNRVYLTGK
ncbi:MAG: sensor domain-containing diguanylate cyclase [Candidatus Omnitrophota bacterium]|nr:sensor domain-containing diguanylate cyclase [Candidatus Omnitrophota bacterium]MBU1929803.1 sensor domain-containing diguanylate cyclase [Candidatus Omnitrophota bacterium]MBU2035195.1 sensor domain-containing diguanylate cyclase [Candidatus Omnitrophota bacterium]